MSWLELCGSVAFVVVCVMMLAEVRHHNVNKLWVIENGKWLEVSIGRSK